MKNETFAKKHGAKVVRFKDLPTSHKMAMLWYMSVDGDAWKVDYDIDASGSKHIKRHLRLALPLYIKRYGHCRFGIVDIPTEAMIKELMSKDDIKNVWKTFKEYHKWYGKNADIPKHSSSNRWPCILSSFDDELLQDGWHRWNSYVKAGHKTIPCIYYLANEQYKPCHRIKSIPCKNALDI